MEKKNKRMFESFTDNNLLSIIFYKYTQQSKLSRQSNYITFIKLTNGIQKFIPAYHRDGQIKENAPKFLHTKFKKTQTLTIIHII